MQRGRALALPRVTAHQRAPCVFIERIDPSTINILESLPNQLAAREALECLSPRYQEILRLRFFEGLSQSEIATQVGLSQMHVSRLLSGALSAFAATDRPAQCACENVPIIAN